MPRTLVALRAAPRVPPPSRGRWWWVDVVWPAWSLALVLVVVGAVLWRTR